ncbi:hypothetical protein ACNO5E_13485 [Vibrio parahaemolyticus]
MAPAAGASLLKPRSNKLKQDYPMYKSNKQLKLRYQWLNRNWVNYPAKIQISMEKEMKSIKETLSARGIQL